MKRYYCENDRQWHTKSELPQSLRSFVDYVFTPAPFEKVSAEWKSFNTKYKHAIAKLLPPECTIIDWSRNHYYCSAIIQDQTRENGYIYLSIPDVRYYTNEWFLNILIRTMKNINDYNGGTNHYTTLFTLKQDITKLWKWEDRKNG